MCNVVSSIQDGAVRIHEDTTCYTDPSIPDTVASLTYVNASLKDADASLTDVVAPSQILLSP